MRILAITFALALVGCVDDGYEVYEGIDDIEEQDDDTGPDTHKSDVDPAAPGEQAELPQFEEGPAAQLQFRPLPQMVETNQPALNVPPRR